MLKKSLRLKISPKVNWDPNWSLPDPNYQFCHSLALPLKARFAQLGTDRMPSLDENHKERTRADMGISRLNLQSSSPLSSTTANDVPIAEKVKGCM